MVLRVGGGLGGWVRGAADTPSCVATPKIIVYPLLCRDTQGVYPSHGGYTPSCVATQKIIVYPLLCRDTGGVYPLLCRDTEDYRIPPCCVATHRGVYPSCEGYTPSCVATQRIIPPLLYAPPVSRHMGGIPPPRHRAHNPAVPSGHFHDTTHNTSSGVNQWS